VLTVYYIDSDSERRTNNNANELTFGKSARHGVFPVEEVGELDVVDVSVIVGVTVVKQLSQLILVDGNVELQTSLVQILPRYQSLQILQSPLNQICC